MDLTSPFIGSLGGAFSERCRTAVRLGADRLVRDRHLLERMGAMIQYRVEFADCR